VISGFPHEPALAGEIEIAHHLIAQMDPHPVLSCHVPAPASRRGIMHPGIPMASRGAQRIGAMGVSCGSLFRDTVSVVAGRIARSSDPPPTIVPRSTEHRWRP